MRDGLFAEETTELRLSGLSGWSNVILPDQPDAQVPVQLPAQAIVGDGADKSPAESLYHVRTAVVFSSSVDGKITMKAEKGSAVLSIFLKPFWLPEKTRTNHPDSRQLRYCFIAQVAGVCRSLQKQFILSAL